MEYRIYWTGTVTGVNVVEADSLEEAMEKAECESIDLLDYPDDWEISEAMTEAFMGDTK